MKTNIGYDNVIKKMESIRNKTFTDTKRRIDTLKPLSNKLKCIRNEYGVGRKLGFNFFSSVSDTYYKENFHSDILKLILDPNTPQIGNPLYIDLFVDLLNAINKNSCIQKFNNKNICVEREEDRIDILIHDGDQAIIVENKINNAVDQKNQLASYVKRCCDKGIEVMAIVYLTLSPEKRPPDPKDDDDSKMYVEYYKDIREKLILLPTINAGRKNDLAHCLMDKCAKQTDDNPIAQIYLQQYSNLLKHLGGKIIMRECEKKIIEEIYLNQESVNVVTDLYETWGNRKKLVGEIIKDNVKDRLNYKEHSGYGGTIYEELDENVSLGFHINLSVGFVCTPGRKQFPVKLKKDLMKILEDKEFDKNYFDEIGTEDMWVYRNLKIDDVKGSIKDMTEIVAKALGRLQELYKKQ